MLIDDHVVLCEFLCLITRCDKPFKPFTPTTTPLTATTTTTISASWTMKTTRTSPTLRATTINPRKRRRTLDPRREVATGSRRPSRSPERRPTRLRLYMVCFHATMGYYCLKRTLDQIHNCDINLEPEYQRGQSIFTFWLCGAGYDLIFRRCVARVEANRHYRLHIPQFLHPPCHLCSQFF